MRKISKMRICSIGLCIFLVAAVFSTAANGHNEPPIALDDEATMDVNEISVIVPILDNDYDMDGYIDNATVKIVDDPLHGKVCVDIVEGKVKYTRESHISSKEDTFTYKVSDAEGAPSNIATVTITFRPGQENTPPVANNDTASIECNEKSIQIEVLTNDIDNEDGTPSLDNITKPPEHGDALINGDKIQYTPEGGFSGTDYFVYQVIDTGGLKDTAIVNVTVDPCQENNEPVAVNDTATMNESEKSIVIKVLKNDYDPDGDIDNTTVKIVDDPIHGKVCVDIIEGKVKYTRNADFISGSDSFTYTVNDTEDATSNVATVTINVNGGHVNDPPVAINDTASVSENNNVVIINVTANDYDIDGVIDPATVNIVSDPSYGSVSVDPITGNITYTLNQNFIGVDIFKYTVNDSEGATSNIATVTIQVNYGQIHCVPIANDDYYKTLEDVRLGMVAPGVLDNDYTISIDIVDECPLIAVLESDVSNGSLILTEDGSFDYIPYDNWNGDDTFTYRACTEDQCSDVATVLLRVTSVNDPPVAVDDVANMDRDTTVSINVTSNDVDIEDGEPNINNITRSPENGTVVIKNDSTIDYISAVGFVGIDSFEYSVIDSGGLTDTATVTITVNQVEEPEEPSAPTGGGGGTSSSPSTNPLPIADASAGEPYHGFVDEEIIFDGSLSYVADGEITSWHWDFGDGTFGNEEIINHSYSSPRAYLVTLTVADDKGATDTDKTTAIIVQPNRPPSGPEVHGPKTCMKDTKYYYAALSRDLEGDNIQYIFDWGDGSTDEGEFLSTPQSYGVSFIHSWNSAGTYTVTVTVSDNQTASSSEISVVVIEPSINYTVVIILGSIIAVFVILSLILMKMGKVPRFGKK